MATKGATKGAAKDRKQPEKLEPADWERLVTEWEASGQSHGEFADKKDLSVWTLRKWIKRLRGDGEDEDRKDGEADGEREPGLDDVLVAAAKKHGALTTGQVSDALGVPANTARRYLQWLVEEKRLAVKGEKRGTRYVPTRARARKA